jgi:hypothetical protein
MASCGTFGGEARKVNGEHARSGFPWDDMSKLKFMGGLGFRNIELFNLALLAHQAWRLVQNRIHLAQEF